MLCRCIGVARFLMGFWQCSQVLLLAAKAHKIELLWLIGLWVCRDYRVDRALEFRAALAFLMLDDFGV